MSWYNHPGCSCYGGPFNGGNCPSCSSVGSRNEFVYDPNPYSYNETPIFYNQPPQHQYETSSCEFCRNDAHYGYNCPPQVPFVYNQDPCYNQNRQSPSGLGSLPSDTIANPRGDVKAITTRSGVAYEGPSIPPTSSSLPKEVEREPKSLLSIKEKLFEIACTPLNENYLAMLLEMLPQKLRDPDKFLIPCDFLELEECLALAVTYPVGVGEDVFVKVGKFHILADFIVVDYDVDPRVPLILGRPFLRTKRALIDVHGEELTL
nr:DNA-directed DNA polymerase [Tanacetum cinerariifolium]